MAARPFIITPRDHAPALDVVGEHITVLGGPERSGPPPHGHPWDESFFVVRGEIEFGIGSEATTALPGTLVHLPAGTVHRFRFGRGGGEFVSMTSRLGASKMFTDIAREVAPVDPEVTKLAEVGVRHGLKVEA